MSAHAGLSAAVAAALERIGSRTAARPRGRLGADRRGARRARSRPGGGRHAPRSGQGADGHLLAQGLRAADEPLPRLLRLLHLPAGSGRAGRPHDGAGRGARRLRGRSAARRQGGALLARRQAGGAVPRAPRVPPPPGHRTTLDYLRAASRAIAMETGLLPHANPGLMGERDLPALREVNVSMGIMLETLVGAAARPRRPPTIARRTRCRRGGSGPSSSAGQARHPVHDRHPHRHRRDAGRARRRAPGHPRPPRALRPHPGGHRPELPGQAAHPDARQPEPALDDLLPDAGGGPPPAGPGHEHPGAAEPLAGGPTRALLAAGLNDWGGVSPLTLDHINPERPWPDLAALRRATARPAHELRERLAIYPEYMRPSGLRPRAAAPARARPGGRRRARPDAPSRWPSDRRGRRTTGDHAAMMDAFLARYWTGLDRRRARGLDRALDGGERHRGRRARAHRGRRAASCSALTLVADELRRRQAGDVVTYVVNRNINFTNVCIKHCTFCAFSRDHREEEGYFLPMDEVVRRAREAWELGATEVCIQAGLPPKLDGRYYIDLCRAIKRRCPTCTSTPSRPRRCCTASTRSGLPIAEYLGELQEAGLGTLPGTSAEILDQEVRDRHRARPHHDRASGSRSSPPRTRSASARPRRSCTATSRRRPTGSGTWRSCATSRRTRAASPSSCRCRSSTRRRRCTAGPGAGTCGRAPRASRSCKMHALARLMLGRHVPQHPVLVGEGGAQARPDAPRRRRQRPRRHADQREHLDLGRGGSRPARAARGAAPARARLGRIPAQRDTTYGILKLYADGRDDDTSPLDAVENADEQFGSYRRLTASSQFRFAKLKPPGAVRGGTELAGTAGRLGECSETPQPPVRGGVTTTP